MEHFQLQNIPFEVSVKEDSLCNIALSEQI